VTHNVEEGTELATDVAFMRAGRLVQLAPRGRRGATEISDAYRRAVTGG
jgi:ABC-type proline/glycine betaine transport system ATPase subunit